MKPTRNDQEGAQGGQKAASAPGAVPEEGGLPLAARNALVERFAYLVPITRRRVVPIVPGAIDPEDLEGEGYLALVKAADAFDPARGVVFKTFVISRLRGAMLEYLRQQDWVPRSVRAWQKRFAQAELTLLTRREAVTWETLAAEIGWDADWCEFFWHCCQAPEQYSLDERLDPTGDGETVALGETIPDPAPGPEALALVRGEQQEAASMAGWLPRRERQAVLLTSEGTEEWAAEQMQVSESRVHQLKRRGLQRLKRCLTR